MPTRTKTRNVFRRARYSTAAVAVGTSALVLAAGAFAVPPRPNDAPANINGNPNEWVTNGVTNDYIADLHRNADPNQPADATLYLRYRCSTQTLYAMVRTNNGATINPYALPQHHFINSGVGTPTLVNANSNNFTTFDTNADGVDDGWEARAVVAIGSISHLQVETHIRDANGNDHLVAPAYWRAHVNLLCREMTEEEKKEAEKKKGNPENPGTPTTPGTPQTPGTPAAPITPGGSANTPTTASPASPATPVTTRRPRIPPSKLVSRKAGPRRVLAGRKAKYTLRVTNKSRIVARKVVVKDILPKGMVLVRRPAGATIKGRVVTWRIKKIGARKTVVRRLQVRLLRSAKGKRCNKMVTTAANAKVSRSKSCTRVTQLQRRPFIPAVTG